MCGRFSFQVTSEQLAAEFNIVPMGFREERRYNIAPGQWVIVVRPERNKRTLDVARWGLVPSWSKDPDSGPKPFNARAEGITEKPTFRGSMRHGRCLIPASGFYEWKTEGKTKTPHYIRPKDGGIWLSLGSGLHGLVLKVNFIRAPLSLQRPIGLWSPSTTGCPSS